MLDAGLHPVDYAIIILWLAVVVGIGWWVSRSTKTGDDLFLAGRSLGTGAVGLSLFASNISSTTLIGLAGAAYVSGIAVANYEWMAAFLFLFMAGTTVPLFLKNRLSTIPEYLERCFDARSRKYVSVLMIFLSIIVDTAGGIYAGTLVLQLFFPFLPFWQTCVAIAIFAGLYTAAGGLRAVVYTDMVQAVVLISGSLLLAILVFAEFGFSWSAATQGLSDRHLSLIRPLDDDQLPWLGTLIGVPILGFYYWSMNQYIVQRILGAKSVAHARRGAALAGFLKLTPLFIMVLPGAFAVNLFPDLENPDMVFPTLVKEILPVGLTGLVLAGLISAILSSIDSALNSASTLVTHDFVMPARKKEMSGEEVRKLGRILTLGFMALAAIWAPMIQNFPGIFAYLQEMFSYTVPPVVAVFAMGMFWRGSTSAAALVTLALGHVCGIAMLVARQAGWIDIHFTILAGILMAISVAIFVIASLLTGKSRREVHRDTMWNRDMLLPEGDTFWWQDYRLHAFIVAALCAVIVVVFW